MQMDVYLVKWRRNWKRYFFSSDCVVNEVSAECDWNPIKQYIYFLFWQLRRRLQGGSKINNAEDLNASSKILSDYYTQEEMLQFKKPKKKKSLRKKDKLDIDALEAEAKSVGLGVGDLGSRSDGRRQALKEEQERNDTEMRSNAYQSALAKAGEASKTLRLGQTRPIEKEEDDTPVFGDDDEDLRKSLERARKLALKKQNEVTSGPQAIALLASSNASHSVADNQNSVSADSQENKVVFTEMEEFVWGLQLDEGIRQFVSFSRAGFFVSQ